MGWEVAVVAFFNSKKVPVSTLHRFSTAALATYAGSVEHSAVNGMLYAATSLIWRRIRALRVLSYSSMLYPILYPKVKARILD